MHPRGELPCSKGYENCLDTLLRDCTGIQTGNQELSRAYPRQTVMFGSVQEFQHLMNSCYAYLRKTVMFGNVQEFLQITKNSPTLTQD